MNVGGRLTTQSGVAITESDRTVQSIVYLTPAGPGLDLTQIYDGSVLQERQFAETALTLTASAHLVNKTYPVFEAWSAGTLFLGTGPAWTGNAPGGSDYTLIRGLLTNTSTITLTNNTNTLSVPTNQATYRGAIGIGGTAGLTEDSLANRLVGNVFNSLPRAMRRRESTANWSYSTAAYRVANNNTANCLTYVQPIGGRSALARVMALCSNSTNTARRIDSGVGVDSSTVDSSTLTAFTSLANQEPVAVYSEYEGFPGIGKHNLYWLECGNGTDVQTWYGAPVQNAASTATNYAPGIYGWVEL